MRHRFLFVSLAFSLALAACGKKDHSDDNSKPVDPKNQSAPTSDQGSNPDNPNPGTSDATNKSTSAAKFEVTKKLNLIRARVVNGRVDESYALFAIKTSIDGANIMDVTLDGKSLTTSTSGFRSAKISKGVLDSEAVKPMMKDPELGLSDDDKSDLVSAYKGSLYFYSEGHVFDFGEEGTVHRVKFIVGKDSAQVGEYEFVIDNRE